MAKLSILYLEGDPFHTSLVNRAVQMSGDLLHFCPDVKSMLQDAEMRSSDVIITDIRDHEDILSKLEFVLLLRQQAIEAPIIVLTNRHFDEYERESYASGSNIHLINPFPSYRLMRLLDKLRMQ